MTTPALFSNTGSLNNTNPDLSGLASNGGPTQTIALLPGSPAIEAIPLAVVHYTTGSNPCTNPPLDNFVRPTHLRPARLWPTQPQERRRAISEHTSRARLRPPQRQFQLRLSTPTPDLNFDSDPYANSDPHADPDGHEHAELRHRRPPRPRLALTRSPTIPTQAIARCAKQSTRPTDHRKPEVVGLERVPTRFNSTSLAQSASVAHFPRLPAI